MPKLKKSYVQETSEDQQGMEKYLTFQQKSTQLFSSTNQQSQSFQHSPIKKPTSSKKPKRSLKKLKENDQVNLIENQKTKRKKSRAKKVIDSPENTIHQNDSNQVLSINKSAKKQKSLKKNNKSSKKKKVKIQQQKDSESKGQEFQENQLRQKEQSNDSPQQRNLDLPDSQSEKQESEVNFNKRLKKKKEKKETEKQDFNILLSKYTEDEDSLSFGKNLRSEEDSNGQLGTKFQSDLRQLDLLVKKKEKKSKKDKQIKIKNKYFSNIQLSQSREADNNYEGEQPPENSEQLIFQKKQPRKTIHNLNHVIEKRVNHIKDRREFKSAQNDLKFKNHLRSKLQQVKDAQQIEVDIEVPNLFTKKTASAALYMKNTLQNEQKKTKFSQLTNQNEPKPLYKTQSSGAINKTDQKISKEELKNQQFKLQYKKKAVNRNDFYSHLTKEIKTKRHTEFNSQEIKECFKTSTLDQQNFDSDLADDVLSNCSSRSGRKSVNGLQRRMSVDSQKSRNSQQSIKSIGSKKQISQNISKWNIEIHQKNGQNSNSKSFNTNKSSRRLLTLESLPISQVKQSDASSSIGKLNDPCSFGRKHKDQQNSKRQMTFDDELIKQQLSKSFKKSFKIFESENENECQNHLDIKKGKDNPKIKALEKNIENQNKTGKKIEEKISNHKLQSKIKSKNTKQKTNDQLDDLLGDNMDERNQQQQKQRKKGRTKRKNKKRKQKSVVDDYESYFEVEAEYSSSQQGHSEEQFQSDDSDLDQDGNIIGLIDKDAHKLKLNERRVKKKFLQDQEKKEKQIIQRIMKGLYGRKKFEQTQSEKKLRKRMEQAAKKNLLEDLDQRYVKQQKIQVLEIPENQLNQEQEVLKPQNQNDQNSRERRKLKDLEQQLGVSGLRMIQNEGLMNIDPSKNEAWKILTPILPVANIHKATHPPLLNRATLGGTKNLLDKKRESKKSIFDVKKNNFQQQIYRKTITTGRQRGDSTGNPNKPQKTSQIHLDIRNTNINLDEDIQI